MTSRGMTLLELLVVLAIIGIIAGIGVMTYVSWINSMKAEAAAAEFGRMVEAARDVDGGLRLSCVHPVSGSMACSSMLFVRVESRGNVQGSGVTVR